MEGMIFNSKNQYEKENIEIQLQKVENITFLNVISVGTEVLKIEAETYTIAGEEEGLCQKFENKVDTLNIICHDEKKRRASTLKKLHATIEDLLNGIEEPDVAKVLSDYFIKYDGIIVSYKTYSQISAINKIIQKYQYKSIDNIFFDIKLMAKQCGESCDKSDTISGIRESFISCLKKYKRIEKIERNKKSCVVNYAYYWHGEYQNYMEWIFCNTSIGIVYYDTIFEKWGITQKEKRKTGMMIESIDTEEIEQQLFKKYCVRSMSDLKVKLKEKASQNRNPNVKTTKIRTNTERKQNQQGDGLSA